MSQSGVLHLYSQDDVQSADWETNKVKHCKCWHECNTSVELNHSDANTVL